MKRLVILFFFLGGFYLLQAQEENIFLNRTFWKTNPSIELVKQKIAQGNNPSQLNPHSFDPISYALIENVDNATIKYLLTLKNNGVNKLTHDGRTYIFWAAYKGNLDMMKYLVTKGAKTDIIDNHGYSLLNFAATTGQKDPKLYDFLIENGANPLKEKNRNGANALLLLVPHLNSLSEATYFTKKGLSLTSVDNDNNGIFNYAVSKGNKELLQEIIKKGYLYNNLNNKGENPMFFATRGSRSGYHPLAYFQYLEKLGITPNIKNNEGRTPLHNLSYGNKDIATLQYFIDKGVDVNQADNEGNTALLNASRRNSLEVIKLLANKTKNINTTNKEGYSALTRALRNNPKVVKFILEKGADVSLIDNKGNNLAYYLIKSYNPKNKEDFKSKLEMLTKAGLAFSKKQKDGSNAYHLAIDKNDTALLSMFKNFKIDINAKDSNGITPLHKAIMTAKNDKIIKYLLANGANKTIKTDMNESVYDLASENELLKKNNIDISFLK